MQSEFFVKKNKQERVTKVIGIGTHVIEVQRVQSLAKIKQDRHQIDKGTHARFNQSSLLSVRLLLRFRPTGGPHVRSKRA